MIDRRVVVSGLGVISSIGIGKEKFWDAVTSGRSGISNVTSFDTTEYRCHYAGEVKNFHPEEFIDRRKTRFLGRSSQLAVSAASLALDDAGFSHKKLNVKRTGVFMGTTMGEKPLEDAIDSWVMGGNGEVSRNQIMQAPANNISSNISMHFKLEGPMTLSSGVIWTVQLSAVLTPFPNSHSVVFRESMQWHRRNVSPLIKTEKE
jgi:3-oxoacyl-[acyl-carrier-protein] synthase II